METIQLILLYSIPILFAITVHEVAHGWVANKLGDSTAKMMGRLTLNPIKHIDPIGTVAVPFLMFYFTGFVFGWAKPVPVTWQNLKRPRRDMAIVALAGPVTNFLMALIWGVLLKLGMIFTQAYGLGVFVALIAMGSIGILVNLILMVLNLLPIPPLDGSRVVSALLPPKMSYWYGRYEGWTLIVVVILLVTGVLGAVMMPVVMGLRALILALFGIA